jgi:hypothetical protein
MCERSKIQICGPAMLKIPLVFVTTLGASNRNSDSPHCILSRRLELDHYHCMYQSYQNRGAATHLSEPGPAAAAKPGLPCSHHRTDCCSLRARRSSPTSAGQAATILNPLSVSPQRLPQQGASSPYSCLLLVCRRWSTLSFGCQCCHWPSHLSEVECFEKARNACPI